jgi:RNA-binding protein YhbY
LIKAQNNKKKLGLSKETIATINSLLRNADLVKFAKSKPLSHEIEDDRKFAELIIKKIQPKVVQYKSTMIAQTSQIDTNSKTATKDVD